ncbi:hypothetical protein Fcan01_24546 [Folsomia candida]|uniref:Uncharacterized protein n=1 Tax=Folsomia candida TaxID=158441 RepID=A0A226D6K7_FOLCA|nr:hypothetical protein Fcan01_24546 [Folsomia candida]
MSAGVYFHHGRPSGKGGSSPLMLGGYRQWRSWTSVDSWTETDHLSGSTEPTVRRMIAALLNKLCTSQFAKIILYGGRLPLRTNPNAISPLTKELSLDGVTVVLEISKQEFLLGQSIPFIITSQGESSAVKRVKISLTRTISHSQKVQRCVEQESEVQISSESEVMDCLVFRRFLKRESFTRSGKLGHNVDVKQMEAIIGTEVVSSDRKEMEGASSSMLQMSSPPKRNSKEVGDAGGQPPKKKNKISRTLADHSKAIKEIRDLLINPVKDGKSKCDDVVGDVMQNLLNIDGDITNQPEDGASQDLLEILNVNQVEPEFGPDLNGAVAESFTNLSKTALPKEKFDEIKKLFLTPQNCKQLDVPRVNPEIWGVLSPKIKQSDFQNQQMQSTLSSSSVALAKLSEKIMQNSKQMPSNLSQDILRLAIQAATLNSRLFQELNIKRKQEIKPCLNNDIAAVCNTPSTPELLFGDNICETIKATKSAAAVMRSSSFTRTSTGSTFANRSRGNYFHSNRGSSLNFNRASFGRGGLRPQYRYNFNQRGSTFRPLLRPFRHHQ